MDPSLLRGTCRATVEEIKVVRKIAVNQKCVSEAQDSWPHSIIVIKEFLSYFSKSVNKWPSLQPPSVSYRYQLTLSILSSDSTLGSRGGLAASRVVPQDFAHSLRVPVRFKV